MKKVSLLIMGVIFAFAGNAQKVEPYSSSTKGESATIHTISPKNTTPISYLANNSGSLAASGDTIKYYDFGSSTGLTLTGNATRGWSLGTTNSWWSNQGINSTSGADWACMNPGDPRQGALSAATYTMTTTAINCTGKNSVVMSFEQFYARFEDTALVQISTNGTSFTTVYDNMHVPLTSAQNGSNPTANPEKVTVNISQLAANQPNVYVRFTWISRQQVQPGIGYGWWIDDLMIFEGANNDIAMNDAYWKPYTDSTFIHYADFYTRVPNRQARQYPLRFGAKFSNLGGATQINAGFKAMVTGPGGFSQSVTATKPSLAPLATDSASTSTDITLTAGVGTYNVDLVATSDSTLELLDDDTLGGSVMVTDSIYARDNNDITGAGAFYYNPNAVWEWEIGAIYEIKTLDTLRGVDWLNMAANTRRANKTGTVQVHVYQVGEYTSNSLTSVQINPIFSSGSINIKDLQGNPDQWIHTPVSRVGGGLDTIGPGNYVVTLRGDQNFGSDTIFWPVQRTDFVSSQYLVRVAPSSGAMGNWSFGGRKFMLRMVTAPSVCPTLVGAVATGKSTTACGNTDGEVEVTSDPTNGASPYSYAWDIKGNVVTGKKVSNLGSGSYEVTITDANGCKVTSSAAVSDFGAPTVTFNATNSVVTTTCFGDKQGKIAINVTAGANPNPNYTFKWVETSNSGVTVSTDSTLTGVEAGTYRVEVNDGSNPPCIQSITQTITGPTSGVTARVAVPSDAEVLCKGDAKGEIEIIPTGGNSSNYTIVWSDNNTSFTRTSLTAGNYAYTVTDGSGCTTNGAQRVTEPSQKFFILPVKYNADIQPSTSGIIDNVKPGKAELSIKVSGGSTTTLASSKAVEWKNPKGDIILGQESTKLTVGAGEKGDRDGSGDYIATAKNANGCFSDPVVFTVFEDADNGLFPLSVTEFGANSTLVVFPNPTKGLVTVQLNDNETGEYNISIKNVVGQEVYNETVSSTGNIDKVIDLGSADAGVYLLNISNGTSEVSKKIIIE